MTAPANEFWDDWMDVADAIGVTRAPAPIHPSLRGQLADDHLAAVLTSWSTAAAGIDPDAPIPYVLTDTANQLDLVEEPRVFSALGYCDTKHEHEIRLVTDGITAYAWGPSTDCPMVWRGGATVVVSCYQPDPLLGELCWGEVRFDLGEERHWTGGDWPVSVLAAFGTAVDS